MYKFLVGTAGVLAIVMIFVAGFQFVVSGDNAGKRSDAKKRIQAALGGLLLAVSSWVILNTINPQLVQINLTSESIQAPGSGGGVTGNTPSTGRSVSGRSFDSPNSFFFGQVGVDPSFVKHTDTTHPLWNYYFGDGTIPSPQQQTAPGNDRIIGTGTSPSNVTPGSTNGSIVLSYFGGAGDVRLTRDGFALSYCPKSDGSLRYPGRVGDFYETTLNGAYRWCYALDASGNRFKFPQGNRSAHGGYHETTAVSGEKFSKMDSLSYYVAYPLSGSKPLSELPSTSGVSNQNAKLKKYSVAVTTKDGTVITGHIADRGPKKTIHKLDVSLGMYNAINRAGGAATARLVDSAGNTITSIQ